ncbi:MAG TPA: class I SAM-dependent methyltransferase [Candidatus Binataceae bacterium]|nr:class I SAM-dependent methyltransferase [Candidatus Binataceae bacterium]
MARLKLPADAAIMEAGCGTGGNLPMLAHWGRVYATEPDDEAREFALAKAKCDIQPGYLPDKLPFGNLSFDLILMTDVLEHLDDDAAALRSLRGRLKPGGVLILTVPAFQGLWSAHDTSHHHKRRYRATRLRELLVQAGYEIDLISYYNFMLFPIIASVRLAQRIAGSNSEGHDLRMPPPWINKLLYALFSSERYFVGRIPLPVGVSLIVAARNPAGATLVTRDRSGAI